MPPLRRIIRFTLIELLVVVAIVAILASLLLPALQSARTTALNAACMGQMAQVYAQFQVYIGENDGYMPSFYGNAVQDDGSVDGVDKDRHPGDKQQSLSGFMMQYIQDKLPTRNASTGKWTRQAYDKDRLWMCPADRIANHVNYDDYKRYVSYGMDIAHYGRSHKRLYSGSNWAPANMTAKGTSGAFKFSRWRAGKPQERCCEIEHLPVSQTKTIFMGEVCITTNFNTAFNAVSTTIYGSFLPTPKLTDGVYGRWGGQDANQQWDNSGLAFFHNRYRGINFSYIGGNVRHIADWTTHRPTALGGGKTYTTKGVPMAYAAVD